MAKKNKIKDDNHLDVNVSDVESALKTEENEFGDIQVDIIEDTIEESKKMIVDNEPEVSEVQPLTEPEAPPVIDATKAPEISPEPEPEPVPEVKPEPVKVDGEIKVGSNVKLNRSVLFTLDRRKIPSFAYDRVFTVTRIIPDRIFIQNKMYTISVNKSDVYLI